MSVEELTIEVINATQQVLDSGLLVAQADGDQLWMVICGVLVFFMHAGFAMLEAGNIRKTSVVNIMFKNIGTVSIGVLAYWVLGYGLAYGPVPADFIGSTSFLATGDFFGSIDTGGFAFWFFQMVFAATAATIVSGAVAGRIKLSAYFIIATALTAFIYPVVSHWIWQDSGWLSAFTPTEDLFSFSEEGEGNRPCGVVDFAGSGVVHMTGGVAAFWGAMILGPRHGWLPGGADFPPHNYALATLGTFILWFGWFGFNAGSTLAWDGILAGQIAITTTLSPSMSCLTGIAISRVRTGKWDLGTALNSILGGLVSITAGCATIPPGLSIVVGAIGAVVYFLSSKLVENIFKIDDPVDAAAVHGFCGIWGLIAVALFTDDALFAQAYGNECDSSVGGLLTWQLLAVVVIIAWVSLFAIILFFSLRVFGLLKLTEEEQENVDATEHGGAAYEKLD